MSCSLVWHFLLLPFNIMVNSLQLRDDESILLIHSVLTSLTAPSRNCLWPLGTQRYCPFM